MIRKPLVLTSFLVLWSGIAGADGIKRTSSGKPDLEGLRVCLPRR